MKNLLGLLLCMFLVSCASRQAAWFGKKDVVTLSKSEINSLTASAKKNWNLRHVKENLEQAIDSYEKLADANHKPLETNIRLSRAYYLLADAHYDEAEKKKFYWEKGVSFGELAMSQNEAFAKAMKNEEAVEDHLNKLDKQYIGAIYWTAVNLGKWGKLSGITTILKYKSRIKKMVERVEELDSNFFYGAAYRYWAAYYTVAPSFAGGSLPKGDKNFKKVIKMFPNYLGSSVLYADYYYRKKGDKKAFESTLKKVLAAKVKKDDIYSENIIEQRKATTLLKKINEIF